MPSDQDGPPFPSEIRNPDGDRLDFAFAPRTASELPTVVIGHGVTANKDRPWAKTLADTLHKHGFPVLRFSFAGNGESEGRFEDATISHEVDDLGAVLDVLGKGPVIYVGHSMGAAVGVIRASNDRRISHLVHLGGMVETKRFVEEEFGEETPDEGVMWDDPACPLSSQFVSDLRKIGSTLPLISELSIPQLVVHGTEDDVVPLAEGHAAYEAAQEPRKLHEIRGADHVFSGDAAEPMSLAVVQWLLQTVR